MEVEGEDCADEGEEEEEEDCAYDYGGGGPGFAAFFAGGGLVDGLGLVVCWEGRHGDLWL